MKKMMGWAAVAMFMVGCGSPDSTTIVVTNGGERDLYTQQNHELTLFADGKAVSMRTPGCMSQCGLFQSEIVCALGAEYPTVELREPGDSFSEEWDGEYYIVPEGQNCWKRKTGNADFEMEVCYSDQYEQFEENGPEPVGNQVPGANLKDEVCERQAFERGEQVDLIME